VKEEKEKGEEKRRKMELTRLFSFFYLRRGHQFDRVSRGV
jgi:hypothetical protein